MDGTIPGFGQILRPSGTNRGTPLLRLADEPLCPDWFRPASTRCSESGTGWLYPCRLKGLLDKAKQPNSQTAWFSEGKPGMATPLPLPPRVRAVQADCRVEGVPHPAIGWFLDSVREWELLSVTPPLFQLGRLHFPAALEELCPAAWWWVPIVDRNNPILRQRDSHPGTGTELPVHINASLSRVLSSSSPERNTVRNLSALNEQSKRHCTALQRCT